MLRCNDVAKLKHDARLKKEIPLPILHRVLYIMYLRFSTMKKVIILPFIILPLLLFSQDPIKFQISNFLDEWHADAARADMQAYFDKIDEAGVYIGTDATENWTKQAFYDWSKPFFDKGKAWTFHATERNIYISEDGTMAWFDEKLKSTNGMLRGSGVLRLKNGEWKIMQYVLSLPVPNDRFKQVMELIK
jgi:hypothetical protein